MDAPAAAPPADSLRFGKHVPALDGLRGLIVCILFVHFNELRNPSGVGEQAYTMGLRLCLTSLDVFFAVSGFLITGILLDSKGSGSFFRTFYARRSLRIFPLYYAFLLLWFVVLPALLPAGAGPEPVAWDAQRWYWSYLTNVLIGFDLSRVPHATFHLWSLAVEEQFYLLWPAVVYLCSTRRLKQVIVGCLVAAPLLRVALTMMDPVRPAAYVLMPTRMDTLALGALLAVYAREPGRLLAVARWAWPVALAGFLTVVAVFLVQGLYDPMRPLFRTVGLTASCWMAGAIVCLAVTRRLGAVGNRLVSSPPLTSLGVYCYAIYVLHAPLKLLLDRQGLGMRAMLPYLGGWRLGTQLVYSVAMTALSFAVAWLSWQLFEKQVLKLKKYFPYTYAGAPRSPEAHDVVAGERDALRGAPASSATAAARP